MVRRAWMGFIGQSDGQVTPVTAEGALESAALEPSDVVPIYRGETRLYGAELAELLTPRWVSATYIARVATRELVTPSGAQTVDGVLIDVAAGASQFVQLANLVLLLEGPSAGLWLPNNAGAWLQLAGGSVAPVGTVCEVREGSFADDVFRLVASAPNVYESFDARGPLHGKFLPQPIGATNIPSISGNFGSFAKVSDRHLDFRIRCSCAFTAATSSGLRFWLPFIGPIALVPPSGADIIGVGVPVASGSDTHSFNVTGDVALDALAVDFVKATNTSSRVIQIVGTALLGSS